MSSTLKGRGDASHAARVLQPHGIPALRREETLSAQSSDPKFINCQSVCPAFQLPRLHHSPVTQLITHWTKEKSDSNTLPGKRHQLRTSQRSRDPERSPSTAASPKCLYQGRSHDAAREEHGDLSVSALSPGAETAATLHTGLGPRLPCWG